MRKEHFLETDVESLNIHLYTSAFCRKEKSVKLKNKSNTRIIKAQINLLANIGKKHLGVIRHENQLKKDLIYQDNIRLILCTLKYIYLYSSY